MLSYTWIIASWSQDACSTSRPQVHVLDGKKERGARAKGIDQVNPFSFLKKFKKNFDPGIWHVGL